MSIWEYERRQKMEERVPEPRKRRWPIYLFATLFACAVLAPVVIEIWAQR